MYIYYMHTLYYVNCSTGVNYCYLLFELTVNVDTVDLPDFTKQSTK